MSPPRTSRGIVVTNTPDVLTQSTAEFTWALILAVTRRLSRRRAAGAARRLEGLGARLHARHGARRQAARHHRPRPDRPCRRRARAGLRHEGRVRGARVGVRRPDLPELSLDELLVSSDVISIHTPLTPSTRHLIDRRALARMKRSAYLVNTARGPVVDEEALAWALKEHLICRRRARRLRARAGSLRGPARSRERRAGAASRERHARDAYRDGRSRRLERPRRPSGPSRAHAGQPAVAFLCPCHPSHECLAAGSLPSCAGSRKPSTGWTSRPSRRSPRSSRKIRSRSSSRRCCRRRRAMR